MTPQDFDKLLAARLDKIKAVLSSKATEYAHGNDRLHNFQVAARIDDTTPEQALWGMLLKHLVSVSDLVKGRLQPTRSMVNEKIGDTVNYLILLEAIFAERGESFDR